MFIFDALGLTSTGDVIRYINNKPSKLNWIQEHLTGMISTGIAAYIAFFVFGGHSFFEGLFAGYLSIIPWVAREVLGDIANYFYSKKYA